MQSTPPTLVILAAGMASRYGSMKQIQGFGPSGETIMDYSIYDAVKAGFKKIVFVIRKEYASDFREIFDPKLKGKVAVAYVFQEIQAFTNNHPVPASRTKPWGTAHAVLCAKEVVREPFAVINADDFYGYNAFEKAYQFLTTNCSSRVYAIIGYNLQKTLSDNGTVNRGICEVDNNGHLLSVNERINISRQNGNIIADDDQLPGVLPINTSVSMNFWCFHPSIFDISLALFQHFIVNHINQPTAEFFIPLVADQFVKHYNGVVKVIPTSSQWFGVTYKEDAPAVKQNLNDLIQTGAYPDLLWSTG